MEADFQGGCEVEEQLQRFQQAVEDLREALQQLSASLPRDSHDRHQRMLLVHRLQREVLLTPPMHYALQQTHGGAVCLSGLEAEKWVVVIRCVERCLQVDVCSRSVCLELRCSSSVLGPEAISRLVRRQQLLQEQYEALSAECEAQLLAVSKEQLLGRFARQQEQQQQQQTEGGEPTAQQQRQQLVALGDEVQDKTRVRRKGQTLAFLPTEGRGRGLYYAYWSQSWGVFADEFGADAAVGGGDGGHGRHDSAAHAAAERAAGGRPRPPRRRGLQHCEGQKDGPSHRQERRQRPLSPVPLLLHHAASHRLRGAHCPPRQEVTGAPPQCKRGRLSPSLLPTTNAGQQLTTQARRLPAARGRRCFYRVKRQV